MWLQLEWLAHFGGVHPSAEISVRVLVGTSELASDFEMGAYPMYCVKFLYPYVPEGT